MRESTHPALRLWARVAEGEPDACWPWPGAQFSNGYGNIRAYGRNMLAHRVAYESRVGPIPEGLVIDHRCRNPICVNPSHLRAVTQAVNARAGSRAQHGHLVAAIREDDGKRPAVVECDVCGEQVGVSQAALKVEEGAAW